MRRLVNVAIAAILVAACVAWYCSSRPPADSSAGKHGKTGSAVPVGVAAVTAGDMNVYLVGLGNISPLYTVTVHTRVSGQLMEVAFQEGQIVKEGDLLALIDPRPFQAALDQALGLLVRDKALLDEARIDLRRYQTLLAQDSIAKQQVDVQASLVRQYEGAVKNDEGTVEAAQVNLVYTRITSPVNGRVGLRQVDPGNIVNPTDTSGIVIVTTLQPITAIFTIPEDNIPEVMQHIGNGIALPAEAWDRQNTKELATGMLSAIDNQVDPTTGTVRFRAQFANTDNALFPSQFVNIRLRLDTLHDAVLAPAAGIQRGTQGAFVYLVNGDEVTVQPVKTGPSERETVAVTQGLKAGDVIVVDGADSLRDKATIEIAARDGKPAGAPAASPGRAGAGARHHRNSGAGTGGPSPAQL